MMSPRGFAMDTAFGEGKCVSVEHFVCFVFLRNISLASDQPAASASLPFWESLRVGLTQKGL
jgi:hypothetical protein